MAGDFNDRCAILIAQLVGGFESRAYLRRDVRRRLAQNAFSGRHLVKRHAVEEFRGQRQQHSDLCGHGHRREFRLLEAGANSPPVVDDLACIFIQPGAEPRKGLELLELRVGELQIARHGTVGRALRLAADARDGFADIDRRQHA